MQAGSYTRQPQPQPTGQPSITHSRGPMPGPDLIRGTVIILHTIFVGWVADYAARHDIIDEEDFPDIVENGIACKSARKRAELCGKR